MRKTFKKILIVLLIILTLNNFLMQSVYAKDPPGMGDEDDNWLLSMLGSVVGLFTLPIRAVALGVSKAINALTAAVAYAEGATDPNDPTINTRVITPFDIFFNKAQILDANFFNFKDIKEDSIVYNIRVGIASWYYILRVVASAILLVVLIYVGIRMAISTVATDKAMYQKMLIDWVSSLAIIFLIHYVIIFTLTVSNALVKSIALSVDSQMISDTYEYIGQLAIQKTDIDSIAATVIFCMLVWQTFGLLISYFNRMLKLAFLVIISPLITLTYSIDKMGDGKAQALSSWLKEYVYTVLMQPVHCIIYMCFIDIAFSLLLEKQGNGVSKETLAVAIISILCVKFVKDAENLVRKIFRFEDDGSGSLGTGLAVAGFALGKAKGFGRGARSAINSTRNFAGNVASSAHGMKIGALAIGRKIGSGGKKSYAVAKEEVRTDINNKKAEKINKRYTSAAEKKELKEELQKRALAIKKESLAKGKKITTAQALYQAKNEKIEKRAQKIKQDYGGFMSDEEARSIARLNIAKENRNKKSTARKVISGAKGKFNTVRSALGQSETLKSLGGLAKGSISAGLGLAVGSGVVGTNGSFLTGIMAGTAMYKGSQEFMKSSSKTIANKIKDNFKALGINNTADMNSRAAGIVALFSDEDKANERLSQIMDELESALQHAGIEGKRKTNIKNIIEGGIKADPSKRNDIINYALSNSGIDINESDTSIDNVRKAAQKLANHTSEGQIYEALQTAGDIGLTMDTVMGEATGSFVPSKDSSSESSELNLEYEESAERVDEAVLNPETYQENMEIAENDISLSNEKDLENLEKELEREKEEILKELTDSDEDKDYINKVKADIERANLDIISRALSNMDQDFNKISDEIKQEYVKKLDEEIKKIGSEKKDASNDAIRTNMLNTQSTKMKMAKDILERPTKTK